MKSAFSGKGKRGQFCRESWVRSKKGTGRIEKRIKGCGQGKIQEEAETRKLLSHPRIAICLCQRGMKPKNAKSEVNLPNRKVRLGAKIISCMNV